jgi:uncharacterized protein (TIGR02453 family)
VAENIYFREKTMDRKILEFLVKLKENNNREWFTENKKDYIETKELFEQFINELIPAIRSFDDSIDMVTAKDCTFRIYRDVRFSKDKSPYKTNMGAYIVRGGKGSPSPGYYIHVEPGNSFLAGGSYMPQADNLKKIREEVMYNFDRFEKIISAKSFKDTFGDLDDSEKLVNPPKGFPKDFRGVEYLKLKSYVVMHPVYDRLLTEDDFLSYCTGVFKKFFPLKDFLNNAIFD